MVPNLRDPTRKKISRVEVKTNIIILPFLVLVLFSTQACDQGNRVWVIIDPNQCLGNPWEQAWLEEHDDDYDAYPKSEGDRRKIFVHYYEIKGVEIDKIKQTYPYDATCDGCDCPRGDRIHCLIHKDDVEQMVAWGFQEE